MLIIRWERADGMWNAEEKNLLCQPPCKTFPFSVMGREGGGKGSVGHPGQPKLCCISILYYVKRTRVKMLCGKVENKNYVNGSKLID